MKNRASTLIGLLVAAAVLVLLYRHWFPNEPKLVERRLQQLAALASAPASASTLATLADADSLRDFFTSDVAVDVDGPGEARETFSGRQEVVQGILTARKVFHTPRIEFLGVQVQVAPDRQSATAELTARFTQDGDREYSVQEFKVTLRREDGRWRVGHAETVRTLRL